MGKPTIFAKQKIQDLICEPFNHIALFLRLTNRLLVQEWTDERLQWNVSDYCGIEHIYLAMSDVWIPEITVVEAHSSEDYREDYKKFVWVQDFPFDDQECYIKMMSQSFSAWEYGITITMSPGLAGNSSAFALMGNGEWQIRNVSTQSVFVETGDQFPFEMASVLLNNQDEVLSFMKLETWS
ncbi:hypothetical protein ANCDUO_22532 [Ancylostoma duodenale]|uniref:Neurotransmitter-gated ion-channel ligand-binding domain-containing protein n=1 Tax=Ancylostoma duodenale TaxID=51022 RepID=A0A0C2BU20_9BILA|nr:hypothetical protein ANCDUO_22532 [Ancylostoma duodenale]